MHNSPFVTEVSIWTLNTLEGEENHTFNCNAYALLYAVIYQMTRNPYMLFLIFPFFISYDECDLACTDYGGGTFSNECSNSIEKYFNSILVMLTLVHTLILWFPWPNNNNTDSTDYHSDPDLVTMVLLFWSLMKVIKIKVNTIKLQNNNSLVTRSGSEW